VDVLAGIFVGGASSRMGGRPKGLLTTADGTPLVDRLRAMFDALAIDHVLVGRRAEYASIPLVALQDAPSGIGPIGGLAALLDHAGERRALAVACDMPFVTQSDVERLLAEEGAIAAAPRRGDRWEPLFAVYDAPRARPFVTRAITDGRYGLQALLSAMGARVVPIDPAHLDDWDSPQDLARKSES